VKTTRHVTLQLTVAKVWCMKRAVFLEHPVYAYRKLHDSAAPC